MGPLRLGSCEAGWTCTDGQCIEDIVEPDAGPPPVDAGGGGEDTGGSGGDAGAGSDTSASGDAVINPLTDVPQWWGGGGRSSSNCATAPGSGGPLPWLLGLGLLLLLVRRRR